MRVNLCQLTRSGENSFAAQARPLTDRDEMFAVNVYDDIRGRVFEGLGGAATEAAAHTYFQMPEDKRQALLEMYFGGGADYRFLRVSADSCDFSVAHYEAMSDKDDAALVSFSLAHDEKEVIPFIRAAQARAGRKLPLLLSPWSPPAFMKTTGKRNGGGGLLPQYAPLWAEYLCRYIQGYEARGFTVAYITPQNEPNATQTWDSCVYSPEQERDLIRDHLYPALCRHGLKTRIFIWDHNKERIYHRAKAVLQGDVRDMVGGVAFHLYTGDHFEALSYTLNRFPEKTLMFSEGCMAIRGDRFEHALRYAHEYIGDMRQDVTILLDWNMLLDQQGGPNHVGNFCSAPVMCDVNTKEITVNPSYRAIKLISEAARPGAARLATSAFHPDIETTAFRRESGDIGLLLLNRADRELPVSVHILGQAAEFKLPALSLTLAIFEN